MYKRQLAEISYRILHSQNTSQELACAKELSVFYAGFINKPGFIQPSRDNETLVSGGVALSSFEASICIDDYLRTARFIKGVYQAIKELSKRFPDQKIHILYAGCGPYATLLLPILPLFAKDALDIILLDINHASLQSVQQLLEILELEDYSVKMVQGDATIYKVSKSWPLHLLISETMFQALIREPQVSVTTNLAQQLVQDGILIPEEISLELVYTFFGKEPYMHAEGDQRRGMNTMQYPGHYKVDALFSINKELSFLNKIHNSLRQFETQAYQVPDTFGEHPDICIFTRIKIFKGLYLDSAESYITNPYCVTALSNLPAHSQFTLVYHFKDIPGWTYQVKE